jgi:hypothetical protein
MNCSEFLTRFSDFYDEPSGSEIRRQAERHMDSCSACRRYFEVVERGVKMLRSMPAVELSPSFGSRLEHRIHHVLDEVSNRRDGNGSAIPVVALVGMAVLLTVVAWVPKLRDGIPEVEIAPIVISDPPSDAMPLRVGPSPFLTGRPGSLLRVDDGLWSDPNSLLYRYSPLSEKYRTDRVLRRTGLD